MESGFERLLFRLYTDQQFRNAVRQNPTLYSQRYGLSEKELEALTQMRWETFATGNLSLTEIECKHDHGHNY